MSGLHSIRSNNSSRSSFIYPNLNSGNTSPKFLSFEDDSEFVDDETTSLQSDGSGASGDDDYLSDDCSGDERYLETRLSDMEFQSTTRSQPSIGLTETDAATSALVPLTGAQIRRAVLRHDQTAVSNHTNFESPRIKTEEHVTSPRASIFSDSGPRDETGALIPEEDLTEDQLRLRREIAKVKRLDKILAKKQRLAQRVKRDTVALQRHVVSEMELLDQSQSGSAMGVDTRTPSREETVNTHKYLAMVKNDIQLKTSNSSNMFNFQNALGSAGPEGEFQPVFATQPMIDEDQGPFSPESKQKSSGLKQRKSKQPPRIKSPNPESSSRRSSNSSASSSHASTKKSTTSNKSKASKASQDKKFIQRNKELAGDAANVIPMTSEERSRLNELLKDMDTIGEVEEFEGKIEASPVPGSSSGTQSSSLSLRYHCMSEEEVKALSEIDDKLSGYLPFEQFKQICWNNTQSTFSFDDRTESETVIGDDKIRETREERIAQIRIAHIDEKLRRLQTEEAESRGAICSPESEFKPNVSEFQLRRLLNELTLQKSSESEQGLIYPKPNKDQIKALLSQSRPETALEDWRYIDASVSSSLGQELKQMAKFLDEVDKYLEAGDDDGLEAIDGGSENYANSSVKSSVQSSKGVVSAHQLREDAQFLEMRSEILLRRLENLPELEDPESRVVPEREEGARSVVSFEDLEQNERLYELDRDMERLRLQLERLQQMKKETSSAD